VLIARDTNKIEGELVDIARTLLATITVLAVIYVVRLGRAFSRSRSLPDGALERAAAPGPIHIAIGFITNFFDTLGIGSFATTTTIYKLVRLVPDERIPGTMLVGHTLPVVTQAFAFITVVPVDPRQLVFLIGAMMAGGWLGAGTVSRLPRRVIQLGMAAALLLAGLFMAIGMLHLYPPGGDALRLTRSGFAIALAANFIMGALATLGIGNYGPSLMLFSLLGMDPRGAFPIMMGSGAFTGMTAAMRFVSTGRYVARAALGLTLGGIPGVLIAVWLVKSLPLDIVRWGVIVVVLYTAVMLLRSAIEERRAVAGAPPAVPAPL
jgi:uncharacterized membrane protein YfcA